MKKYMALLLAVALFIQLGFSSMATEQDVSVTADENIEETAEEEDLKADAETAGEEEAEDGENAEIAGEEETEAGEDAEIA
ncbi:MAG: hypothetical protein LUD73_04215 [Lachnospiraceae bacterium]|nr:hypothetical protein [Lachnospiraceae bacterium]